jgi:hypothetical protein
MSNKAKDPAVHLGQEVFVLTTTGGDVERTLVGAIDGNGYTFLNGHSGRMSHWFTYAEAAEAAEKVLEMRVAQLRKEIQKLTERRKILKSSKQAEVMTAPYKVVDLRLVDKPRRPRRLVRIQVPESYLSPGDLVYVAITPNMSPPWVEAYKPYLNFVLETEVRTVCFSPDGTVDYTFVTPFVVKEFFLTKDEAIKEHESFFGRGTPETVPFVSLEEERQKLSEIKDTPF